MEKMVGVGGDNELEKFLGTVGRNDQAKVVMSPEGEVEVLGVKLPGVVAECGEFPAAGFGWRVMETSVVDEGWIDGGKFVVKQVLEGGRPGWKVRRTIAVKVAGDGDGTFTDWEGRRIVMFTSGYQSVRSRRQGVVIDGEEKPAAVRITCSVVKDGEVEDAGADSPGVDSMGSQSGGVEQFGGVTVGPRAVIDVWNGDIAGGDILMSGLSSEDQARLAGWKGMRVVGNKVDRDRVKQGEVEITDWVFDRNGEVQAAVNRKISGYLGERGGGVMLSRSGFVGGEDIVTRKVGGEIVVEGKLALVDEKGGYWARCEYRYGTDLSKLEELADRSSRARKGEGDFPTREEVSRVVPGFVDVRVGGDGGGKVVLKVNGQKIYLGPNEVVGVEPEG